MELLTGDETGLFKALRVDGGQQSVSRIGEELQSRSRGVCQLALAAFDGVAQRFHASLVNGCIETYERVEGEAWKLASVCEGLADEPAGLFALAGGRVATVGRAGDFQVSSLAGEAGDVANWDTSEGKEAHDVSACDVREATGAFLVGGRETEASQFDLETGARTWRAKNVPHDKLDMRRPVFVGAAAFLGDHEVAVGTAYAELRYYDVRASRRPVHEVKDATDRGVKAIAVLDDGTVVLGDQTGDIKAYDPRTRKLKKRFAGPSGSVRALAKHPTRPNLFAACALDRHVYVWDVNHHLQSPVAAVYCKQRLQSFAWLPDDTEDRVEALLDDDDDDDDDDDEP